MHNFNIEKYRVAKISRATTNPPSTQEDHAIMVTTVAIALGCECDKIALLPFKDLVPLYDSIVACTKLLNLTADQVNDLGKQHGFEAVVGIRRIP